MNPSSWIILAVLIIIALALLNYLRRAKRGTEVGRAAGWGFINLLRLVKKFVPWGKK